MDWFKKSVVLAYFPRKDFNLKDKWVRLRGVAVTVGLSPKAKQCLEWIIFYNTVGKCNAKLTAEYFGISRKTFHKYLKRFDETNLKSLEEHPKAPINTRVWTVTLLEEKRVAEIRNFSKCKWGKVKVAKRYSDIYGEKIINQQSPEDYQQTKSISRYKRTYLEAEKKKKEETKTSYYKL